MKLGYRLILSCIFLSLSSCVKDVLTPEYGKLEPEVVRAREWVIKNQDRLDESALLSKSKNIEARFLIREIDWDRAITLVDSKNRKVVEAPVNYPNGFVFGTNDGKAPPKSLRKSVVLVPQTNGEYRPAFLKIIHSDPDHIFTSSNFYEIGYLNIPSDFSGTFTFYNWDESMVGGIGYEKGEIKRNFFPKK